MAQPEQNNFFFVVEDGRDATVYARGQEGRDVLSSLSRLSLVHLSTEERQEDRAAFGLVVPSSIYTETEKALATFDSERPHGFARYELRTRVLSNLMHSWSNKGLHNKELAAHNNNLVERVREGVRSPQSVNDELHLQMHDREVLRSVSRRWFNRDGWVLTRPDHRPRPGKSDLDLMQLYRLEKRNSILDTADKEALFDAVPRGGQAYSAQRVPLNYHKVHRSLSDRRPFVLGAGVIQDVYGYVAQDSKDFVPVIARDRSVED